MISRRDFLKISVAGGAAIFLAGQTRFAKEAYAAQNPQVPLPGSAIPQFVDPVPNLLAPESPHCGWRSPNCARDAGTPSPGITCRDARRPMSGPICSRGR